MMTEEEIVNQIIELVAYNLVWVTEDLKIDDYDGNDGEFEGMFKAYFKVLGREFTEEEKANMWKRRHSYMNNV